MDINLDEISDSVIGFGEFAKSIDATLSDELLKTKSKLWLTTIYKNQRFSEDILSAPLKQQIGGMFMGLDKDISTNLSVGAFTGLGLGYQNIGQGSKGHVASLTLGAYANYKYKGFLASTYLRAANYIHDFSLLGSLGNFAEGTMYSYGWSASLQLMQKISLPISDMYIAPKAKATYTYVEGKSYDIGGLPLENLDITGLVTWLGARVGMEKDRDDEKPYEYYLEAGWIHDTNPSITVVDENSNKQSVTLGSNRFEVGVGFSTSPLGISDLNLEVKYSKGKGIEELIKINFGGSFHY